MRRVFSWKRYGAIATLVAMLILGGCASVGGVGAAYEDDECRVTDLAIDRSGGYAEVTAVFENKTSSDEKFLATVALLDDSGTQIGDAMVVSEDAEAGQVVASSTGLISIDGGFVDVDDAALDRVTELKVESVTSKTAIGEYLSSTDENAADPLVGYWKVLRWNWGDEPSDVSGNGRVFAEFRTDGTWTLTLEDKTYDNVWETTGNDGIPYMVGLADEAWGGAISSEGSSDMLVIGSLSDTAENNMVLQRAE